MATPDTKLVRALRDLNVESICAHSPQAKGRVERANQTLQDRLIKEMRLKGISTIEETNAYLPAFIHQHNERFSVQSSEAENAHRPNFCTDEQLHQILSIQTKRILSKNFEFSLESQVYQVSTPNVSNRLKHKAVTVCQMMDGAINVTWNQMSLMVETLSIFNFVRFGSKTDISK